MKTKFSLMIATVIAITIFSPQKSNGQQAWILTGNNNATAGSKLGALSNVPVTFVANGNPWMRLETDGRVNINADGLAPSLTKARLAINSSINQDPFRVMINGNTRFLVNEKGGASIGTTTEGPAQGLYVFGNVGIGQSTPAAKLHITGGSDAGLNGGFIITGDLASDNMGIDNNEIQTRIGGVASTLYLNNDGGDINLRSDAMHITNGKLVGIGTASPLAKLHVVGTSFFNGSLGIGTASPIAPLHIKSTGTRVAAFDGPTGMYIEVNENGAARGYFGSAAGNNEDFELGTNSLNSTGKLHLTIKAIPKMTIDASGKVGIGTTAPGATLHVATGDDSKTEGGGFIVTGTVSSQNISMDQNEIMARDNGKISTLYLNHSGGNVVIDGTSSGSNVGIGTATPDYQLQLTRNSAAKPGNALWTIASAAGSEKNIADFTDGLNVIKQIHPVSYNYDGETGIVSNERFVGTLGRELQKVAPYMVKEWAYQKDETSAKTNYLGVDYNALLFMFVNAIKEQQEEIKSLDTKIEELTKLVMNNQTSSRTSSTQTNAVTSKVITAHASLEQNAPNPFNSSTVIRYHIPASVSTAQIMVTNASGNMIKTFTLNNKGAGSVTIKAGELAAGNYYYTLITDGKKADSKQMILNK